MPRKTCSEPGCTTTSQPGYEKCYRHGGWRVCIVSECTLRARKGDKCRRHGGYKVNRKLCDQANCERVAISGFGRCMKHGASPRKFCDEPNCSTAAQRYGKCFKHGGTKSCTEPDCTIPVRKGGMCPKHGGSKKKKCNEAGCTSFARSDKCFRHNGGKICKGNECMKPSIPGREYCRLHGGGCCSEPGCRNASQDKKTDRCKRHGGGRRCPNCIDWPDSRSSNSAYDNYCATCFKRLFPDDPRSRVIHEHTKEVRVRNAIQARFEGFVHDKPLYTGNCRCTHRRRVDHRKLIGNTILAIETDEYAHGHYDPYDEEIRYDDLYMIHSGKWIFIRFNPDRTQTCKVDLEDRIDVLLDEIERQMERIENEENVELVEIHKLFYDADPFETRVAALRIK